ncbi:MAG: FkbM family methyltransferase [Saprospiraceae bacterium]|nr:FkbM family methyltransferase [Saprospiraceae bacterium]
MLLKKFLNSLRQKLVFSLSSGNSCIFLGFYKYVYRPSPGSLAFEIDRLSKKYSDFFVLQIGANDGITHDPVHKFIKRDQWNGILLEPQKDVFDKFLRPLYQNQKGIKTIHAALGHHEGEATIFRIGFSTARWATGLTSFNKKVLENAFASGHVARQAKKQGIAIPDAPADWIVEEKVPVITVQGLTNKFKISKIDLLQIDTEGFDYEIIQMFDFGKLRPKAISYENSHLSAEDRDACEELLSTSGYRLMHFGGNTLALSMELI